MDKAQFDALFLKVFEVAWRSYSAFILEDFEELLRKFKNKTENLENSYLIYFPGTNLYIYELDGVRRICKFCIVNFFLSKDEGFFGG